MRIAAISDIHGNLAALDAVLADIATRKVDVTVNLGDICSGALFPVETADRLMRLSLPTIRGNHERQVLTLPLERMGPSDALAATLLRPDQRRWLEDLPGSLRLADGVTMVHGTPDSDLTYFLETVEPHGLREATQDEIASRAGALDGLILCGHSHLGRVVRLPDGRTIVNAGSVGLPAYDDDRPHPHLVESGSPHARYAIVDDHGGDWSAELIAVVYDWETAAAAAEARGRQDWARALRTGRA